MTHIHLSEVADLPLSLGLVCGFHPLADNHSLLRFPHQVHQRFEHLGQPDEPVGHIGSANIGTIPFQYGFGAIQR